MYVEVADNSTTHNTLLFLHSAKGSLSHRRQQMGLNAGLTRGELHHTQTQTCPSLLDCLVWAHLKLYTPTISQHFLVECICYSLEQPSMCILFVCLWCQKGQQSHSQTRNNARLFEVRTHEAMKNVMEMRFHAGFGSIWKRSLSMHFKRGPILLQPSNSMWKPLICPIWQFTVKNWP